MFFIKRIIWVSRHAMTNEQKADLERIYGQTELIQYDETLDNIAPLLALDADVYAVVLSAALIADLIKATSAEVIQPVSGRVRTGRTVFNSATGRNENEYVYKHLCWQRIVCFEFETERL